ncbi:MAG TPA: alpha/beta hydrolase [Roseiflexaceae bacterium]|jgi:pimeloyl-ACP methyl ester carboxylesterase|nr:alpha/beta hydrolase [Roseiflexaceae bacterium]
MLVDVGSYRLHLLGMGRRMPGQPAVILVAGAGGFSLTWSLVQPVVAQFAQVYSYDRGGYGWSDSAPAGMPRDAACAARELDTLLARARIAPPYLLVGHSFGGFVARRYAAEHPQDVAGMVLVDADHEDEWTERFPPAHRNGLRLVTRMLRVMAALGYIGFPQALVRLNLLPLGSLARLPRETRRMAVRLGYSRSSLAALASEFAALEASSAQMRGSDNLGDRPLVVIRHGLPGPTAPGVSAEQAAQIERTAAAAQADLARLSSRGKLITAEQSGHDIMLDQPAVISDAIRTLLAEIADEQT